MAEQTNRELTAHVVAAFVRKNSVSPDALPDLIRATFASIAGLDSSPAPSEEPAQEPQKPAVSIKKSVTDDYIICLEDGKKFKSLKRHLMTHYNMSPAEYRAKWGLSADYPMVAASYAAARSAMAKKAGFGRKTGAEPAPAPAKNTSRASKILEAAT